MMGGGWKGRGLLRVGAGGRPEMKANRALGVQIRLDRSAPVRCWGESPRGRGLSPLIDVCREV